MRGSRMLIGYALLWLAGVSLRLTILAVPPVIPLLHTDLGLSQTDIGILSSLPSLLLAAAAIPGSLLIARFGAMPALAIGLLLTAIGSAARGAADGVPLLYAMTMVMGAGIAIMQPALPPLVRAWLPRRIGFATALYMNGLLVGEIFSAGLTIPVVLPLLGQSWRWNFVVWSVPVFATLLLAAFAAAGLRHASAGGQAATARWWPDWRQPLVWRLAFILGGINCVYFGTNAFLPDFLTQAGRPDLINAALTSLNLCQLPGSFLTLAFADSWARKPLPYAVTGGLSFASLIAMQVMPGLWVVGWAGVLGCANAVTLVLVFALPPLLCEREDVPRTTAGMLTISYSTAVVIPVLGGWLWDVTGSPLGAFLPIAVMAALIVALPAGIDFADRG